MRWWVLTIAVLAWWQPAVAANPGDGPGCIGVALTQCVDWLRHAMTLEEGFLADALRRRHETDVNGRPLGGGLVVVRAHVPGDLRNYVLLLHLRPDDTVRSVESNVQVDLLPARTEQVYDQSGLYDIVTRVVGRRCPAIARLDLYRFFENRVKPLVTQEQQDISTGLNGLHRIVAHAAAVPYCGGISLAYTRLVEWRGGKNPAGAQKPSRFSSIELQ